MVPEIYIQIIGFVGNAVLVLSSLPQIKKMIERKSVEDISIWMWIILLISNALLLLYAALRTDIVFTILFTILTVENLIALYLIVKYRKKEELPQISAREKAIKEDNDDKADNITNS